MTRNSSIKAVASGSAADGRLKPTNKASPRHASPADSDDDPPTSMKNSSSAVARANRAAVGRDEKSRATSLWVLSILLAAAAIVATYWTATSQGHGGRPAPPNPSLRAVALGLLQPQKGILAADESPTTFSKRLSPPARNNAGVRRQWRRTVLTAPGLEEHISGVILHEETFQQLPEEVAAAVARGVAAGIKLDQGITAMKPKKAGEALSKGLEGLEERCRQYRDLGASFAKWRAVFRVGPHTPSKAAVRRNAEMMAEYAAVVQSCGLVPIVEPEVLAEGGHCLGRAAAAASRVLRGVYRALRQRGDVDLGAVLLKAAMVTPGDKSTDPAEPEQVANATLRLLLRTVPRVVPGIVFLSGGQSEEAATANMLALGRIVAERARAGKPPL